MAKRRTKKQKQNAKHAFTISWGESSQTTTSHASVKREKVNSRTRQAHVLKKQKNTSTMAKDDDLVRIKHDLIKSVAVAIFILSLQLVLYWARK